MIRDSKRGKLAQTYDCLKYANGEFSKLDEDLKDLVALQETGKYASDYIAEMQAEKKATHEQKAAEWRQAALKHIDELYNEIIGERPDIMGKDFQYANTMAQILGDSMTYEQAFQAIEPLRGQITALDILRQSYYHLGAPTAAFSEFTFYEAARDVIPEQTTKDVFERTATFISNGNLTDACICLKGIADILLGKGAMEFLPNFGERLTAQGMVSGVL